MPKHSQIRYITVNVIKQIAWDLWGFKQQLKAIGADFVFTLNDCVNINHKYLLYYFEIPDYRFASNRINAGWYQKISDQITKCFLKRTLMRASHIAASSFFTRDDLLEKYTVPEEKISVIYPAPDILFIPCNSPKYKQQIRKKYRSEDGYLLHFSSNNDPRDNTGTLMKAFSLSLSLMPHNCKLVVCGVDRLRSFGWGETLHKLGLADKIIFTGFISNKDLCEVYQGADAYIDTSLYEGFGFQVVEAMACGLPIICSCTSSLPEVAKDAAIFVDQNNKQSIADAIVSVIGDRDKRRELSEKSLQQVKKFSWERTTREIVALLESFSKDVL